MFFNWLGGADKFLFVITSWEKKLWGAFCTSKKGTDKQDTFLVWPKKKKKKKKN
jgi:hypothetical protein